MKPVLWVFLGVVGAVLLGALLFNLATQGLVEGMFKAFGS